MYTRGNQKLEYVPEKRKCALLLLYIKKTSHNWRSSGLSFNLVAYCLMCYMIMINQLCNQYSIMCLCTYATEILNLNSINNQIHLHSNITIINHFKTYFILVKLGNLHLTFTPYDHMSRYEKEYCLFVNIPLLEVW